RTCINPDGCGRLFKPPTAACGPAQARYCAGYCVCFYLADGGGLWSGCFASLRPEHHGGTAGSACDGRGCIGAVPCLCGNTCHTPQGCKITKCQCGWAGYSRE